MLAEEKKGFFQGGKAEILPEDMSLAMNPISKGRERCYGHRLRS